MIEIKDRAECCGCEACAQICPKDAISLREDREGFRYPKVDLANCINCGLCDDVCTVTHRAEKKRPLKIYAARTFDEKLRAESSSGGIFTLLAKRCIEQGGVVYGAAFNNKWQVTHQSTQDIEGLAKFRGSKYSQSIIGDSFKEVEAHLKEGRKVLFSGTPCQIAGLKRYIKSNQDRITTVDFICHGVPSPRVWREYLAKIADTEIIESVKFRNKVTGWNNYSLTVAYKEGTFSEPSLQNSYIRGFVRSLYLRPSCHKCPARSFRSGSDITIADFWGIEKILPNFDNDRGSSLILTHSKNGEELFNEIEKESIEITKRSVLQPSCFRSSKPHRNRELLFEALKDRGDESIGDIIERMLTPTPFKRFKLRILKILQSFIKI